MTERAVSRVQIANARTRVTEWSFAPGAETGFHRHEHDYVVVPQTTGELEIVAPDGSRSLAPLTAGEPYFREVGVEHNVINANAFPFVFTEVEFL